MGCKCKRIKKIRNMLTGQGEEVESKTGFIGRLFQSIILMVVLMLILPLAIIYICFSYAITGTFVVQMPNFLKNFH